MLLEERRTHLTGDGVVVDVGEYPTASYVEVPGEGDGGHGGSVGLNLFGNCGGVCVGQDIIPPLTDMFRAHSTRASTSLLLAHIPCNRRFLP